MDDSEQPGRRRREGPASGTGAAVPPWLLRPRVTVPDQPTDYCHRVALIGRCVPTRQRVTLLMAPGGFGKTTLLAACCRQAMAEGVRTAWLSIVGNDDPTVLDTYLQFAFEEAGLDLRAEVGAGDIAAGDRYPRTALLLRVVEACGEPCVLALDELERTTNPESVALLNFLFKFAPPNLHLAFACRELPKGLDAVVAVLGAKAEIVTAEDLRFSVGDVARFFDLKLSRRELSDVMSASGGWPIALRMCRNEAGRVSPDYAAAVRNVIENWLTGRFWDEFPEGDRSLILDMGLFEWMDAALVEEVLESPTALARIIHLPGLAGLLERAAGGVPAKHTLHPLIREHCAMKRRRETPERYHEIHRRIATALARRGETVAAMRHAAEAGDPGLTGRILIEAGCLQWWLREGSDQLMAASRFLTDEVVAANARLALARGVVLVLTGRLAEARRIFRTVAPGTGLADDLGFQADWSIARGLLVISGCEPLGSEQMRDVVANGRRIADRPDLPPMLRATADCGLCVYHNLRAEFDAALKRGSRGRRRIGRRSTYLTAAVDFQFGQVAMARGEVKDALKWYRNGMRAAKARRLHDPGLVTDGDVLMRELNLERNRVGGGNGEQMRIWKEVYGTGSQFASYAASSEMTVELVVEREGADQALSELDEMWDRARVMGLAPLERHLAALYVSVLADAGRAGEAEPIWRDAGLPEVDAGCIDLDGQTWREMESIACARLRLHAARGDYDMGRALSRALVATAADRGLKRTWLRALALSTVLEQRAGGDKAAVAHVESYVQLYDGTDYSRPLMRAGSPGAAALQQLLGGQPDGPLMDAAQQLWSAIKRRGVEMGTLRLTTKQREVLARLPTQRDKEIAAALGLSTHGVRFHLRNIFQRLGVRDRSQAVARGRALGLLPPEDG